MSDLRSKRKEKGRWKKQTGNVRRKRSDLEEKWWAHCYPLWFLHCNSHTGYAMKPGFPEIFEMCFKIENKENNCWMEALTNIVYTEYQHGPTYNPP